MTLWSQAVRSTAALQSRSFNSKTKNLAKFQGLELKKLGVHLTYILSTDILFLFLFLNLSQAEC